MRISVEILPWLSTSMRPGVTGRISLTRQLAGATVRDLLHDLAEVEAGFGDVIFDREAGELRYPALVMVNSQLLEFLGGLDTRLTDGDTVTFMAAYTGG